jgi:hypothetical protein
VKNLIVANFRPNGKASERELQTLVEAQCENSLALGWSPRDLVVATNHELSVDATVIRTPLNDRCLTGSKMFALEHLFSLGMIHHREIWWAHDLDAWQNFPFEAPSIADIALAEYSTPKFNGGSVLLRASSADLVCAIASEIRHSCAEREEPAINRVLRKPEHAARVTTLNSTFNVGCSAYAIRYERSHLPILVSHFHPLIKSAWRTHVAGKNKIGKVSVSPRLTDILVRRFHGGEFPRGEWETPAPKRREAT